MDIPHFVDGHLGFYFFTVMNNVSVNVPLQVFVCTYIFTFGHVPRSGISGSYGNPF